MKKSSPIICESLHHCNPCNETNYKVLMNYYGPKIKQFLFQTLLKNSLSLQARLQNLSPLEWMDLLYPLSDKCKQLAFFIHLFVTVTSSNACVPACSQGQLCLPLRDCKNCADLKDQAMIERLWKQVALKWSELDSTLDMWNERIRPLSPIRIQEILDTHNTPAKMYTFLTNQTLPSCATVHFFQTYPSKKELEDLASFNFFKIFSNSCFCDTALLALFAFPHPWITEQLKFFPLRLEKLTKAWRESISKNMPANFLCQHNEYNAQTIQQDVKSIDLVYQEVRKAIAFIRTPLKECKKGSRTFPTSLYCWQVSQETQQKDLRAFMDQCSWSMQQTFMGRVNDVADFIERLFSLLLFPNAAEIIQVKKKMRVFVDPKDEPQEIRISEPVTPPTRHYESIMIHLVTWSPEVKDIQSYLKLGLSKPAFDRYEEKKLQEDTKTWATTGNIFEVSETRFLYDTPYAIFKIDRKLNGAPLYANATITLESKRKLSLNAIVCYYQIHYVAYLRDAERNLWFYYNDQHDSSHLEVLDYDSVITNTKENGTLFFYN